MCSCIPWEACKMADWMMGKRIIHYKIKFVVVQSQNHAPFHCRINLMLNNWTRRKNNHQFEVQNLRIMITWINVDEFKRKNKFKVQGQCSAHERLLGPLDWRLQIYWVLLGRLKPLQGARKLPSSPMRTVSPFLLPRNMSQTFICWDIYIYIHINYHILYWIVLYLDLSVIAFLSLNIELSLRWSIQVIQVGQLMIGFCFRPISSPPL